MAIMILGKHKVKDSQEINMNISYDGNLKNPEIEISNSINGLINLGNILINFDNELEIFSSKQISRFYPDNLDDLLARKVSNSMFLDVLEISIAEKNLVLEGSDLAHVRLGRSLLNYFDKDSQKGQHLHLNYFPGHSIFAPTKCELIIIFED